MLSSHQTKSRVFVAALIVLSILAGAYVEQLHGLRYARLLQCCLLAVCLLALVVRLNGRVRDWSLTVVSIVGGLVIAEGVALLLEAPPSPTTDSGMFHDRPVVGWGASAPGVYAVRKTYPDGRPIFDVRVTIDKNLIRKTESGGTTQGVAFFGDSMVFGEGLNDGDTLPQSFADQIHRKAPVFNLAYSGWSPAQNLAALEAGLYKPLLEVVHRAVLTTMAWHVDRTNCQASFVAHAPRYKLVGDDLQPAGRCASALSIAWHAAASRFALYRLFAQSLTAPPTRHDVETYLKIVQTFVATAKRAGIETTILFLPFHDQHLKASGFTEDDLVAAFKKTGADVLVDALPPIADPSLYKIQGDGHPTGLANRQRAMELAAHLGMTDSSSEPGTTR